MNISEKVVAKEAFCLVASEVGPNNGMDTALPSKCLLEESLQLRKRIIN